MIDIIVAVTLNGAIGKNNDQLYYISGDLKRFRNLTLGKAVIMGSRTFEALPKGALPGRKNIVLSRGKKQFSGAETAATPLEAIEMTGETDGYVIGGEQIYKLFLPYTQKIYVTLINVVREDADKFFPLPDSSIWKIEDEGQWLLDEKNSIEYKYITYTRKNAETGNQ